MNGIVTVSREKESTAMKTFTIDTDNNITVHSSRKAARDTGAGVFASEQQLAELIGPDNKRLVEIWNSLAGVKPVSKFANRKVATERIWKAIQDLGDAAASDAAAQEHETGAHPRQLSCQSKTRHLPARHPVCPRKMPHHMPKSIPSSSQARNSAPSSNTLPTSATPVSRKLLQPSWQAIRCTQRRTRLGLWKMSPCRARLSPSH